MALELDITKTTSCNYGTGGGTLYYVITIENNTDYIATQVVLTDNVSTNLNNPEFSLDGETWIPWNNELQISDINSNESGDIIIRGQIKAGLSGTIITNSATVKYFFCPTRPEEEL